MRTINKLLAMVGAAIVAAACEGPTGFTATSLGNPGATGSIAGTVTADGAGLGGVGIVAQAARRDSTVTDGTGAYRFDAVSTGQYTVSVQVPIGFQLAAGSTASQTVTVSNGGTATANFALQRSAGAGTP